MMSVCLVSAPEEEEEDARLLAPQTPLGHEDGTRMVAEARWARPCSAVCSEELVWVSSDCNGETLLLLSIYRNDTTCWDLINIEHYYLFLVPW